MEEKSQENAPAALPQGKESRLSIKPERLGSLINSRLAGNICQSDRSKGRPNFMKRVIDI